MGLELSLIESAGTPPHCFDSYDLVDPEAALRELASDYHALLTATAAGPATQLFEGISDWKSVVIGNLLSRYAVPPLGTRPLDVVRADFGEVLAYALLQERFQTRIGYKLVRDRELPGQPGRGIDVVGIEEGVPLTLVLAEVKVSAQDQNPPWVVDRNPDSIRQCLVGRITDHARTAMHIVTAARKTSNSEVAQLLFAAAELWAGRCWDRLRIICCGVLVRQKDRYTRKDFGSLLADSSQVGHGVIRFLIVCIPGDLEAQIRAFYAKLPSSGAAI
jgi:hypothetical protein